MMIQATQKQNKQTNKQQKKRRMVWGTVNRVRLVLSLDSITTIHNLVLEGSSNLYCLQKEKCCTDGYSYEAENGQVWIWNNLYKDKLRWHFPKDGQ